MLLRAFSAPARKFCKREHILQYFETHHEPSLHAGIEFALFSRRKSSPSVSG